MKRTIPSSVAWGVILGVAGCADLSPEGDTQTVTSAETTTVTEATTLTETTTVTAPPAS